jgi:hypothetical protein
VIVQVFAAQRQTVDPLGKHLLNGMFHPDRIPAVEKTFRQSTQKIQTLVGLAQQKRAAIGTDRPAVETGHNLPLPAGFESEARLVTLCHSEGRPLGALTVVWKLSYATNDGLLPIAGEKSGLGEAAKQLAGV